MLAPSPARRKNTRPLKTFPARKAKALTDASNAAVRKPRVALAGRQPAATATTPAVRTACQVVAAHQWRVAMAARPATIDPGLGIGRSPGREGGGPAQDAGRRS